MIAQLRAELLKLRTVRLYWGLLLLGLLLAGLFTTLNAVFSGQQGAPGLDSDAGVSNVWASASGIGVITLVAGILIIAGEFRHQTVTTTFLAAPRRSRVVLAKIFAGVILGALYGVLAAGVTAAIAIPVLEAKNATGTADVTGILIGSVLVSMCYAVVGVGVGSLVRNQVAAVVGALIWVFIIEGLLTLIPWIKEDAGQWLPAGAVASLSHQSGPGLAAELLPVWAAALVLCGYGVVLAALGAITTVARDVT